MSNTARVVCWANRDEWTEIYQCLYSFDNTNLQRKGVDRVMAWKSRSGGKLPLAIECTLDLVLAHLADSVSFNPEVRLILSMALVRFVNGMVDLNQKGLYARSVQAIAEEIGLPDWLVDLRHEATHANFPSQHTLRAGVHVALSWLREEYWEAQIKMHKDSEEKLCEMLENYQSVCAKKKKEKNLEKQEQKIQVLAQEIANFTSINNLWSFLQDKLLENGLKTETEDNLNSSSSDQAATTTVPSEQLSDEAIKTWKPLFQALDKEFPDFIPSLLVSILDPVSFNLKNKIPDKNNLVPWALWLLQSCSTFTAKYPWLTLLEVSLKNPNSFTRELVNLILKEIPSLPDTLKRKIILLLNITFNEDSLEKNPDEFYKCRSLQQILQGNERLKSVQQPVQDKNPCLSSGWSVSGGQTKWNLIPFGEVLGCENQSLNLLELTEFFITHNEFNPKNNNLDTCNDVMEEDIDATEVISDATEVISDETELSDEMANENDITYSTGPVLDVEKNREPEISNKEQEKIEICLF